MTKSTTSQLSYAQTMQRASAELDALTKERDGVLSRIASYHAELDAMASQQRARAVHLATLQQTLQHQRSAYDAAQTSSRLSAGTIGKSDDTKSLRELENVVKTADREYSRAVAKSQGENDQDAGRLATLQQKISDDQAHVASLDRTISLVTTARNEAHTAHGESEYRDVVFQRELLNKQIEARRQAVIQAESELTTFLQDSVDRLDKWPELQKKVKQSIPYEDNVTRLHQAALDYRQQLCLLLPVTDSRIVMNNLIEVMPEERVDLRVMQNGMRDLSTYIEQYTKDKQARN